MNAEAAIRQQRIAAAAALLVGARRSRALLDGLPASCMPLDVDEAHEVQHATAKALGERIAGWKVGSPLAGRVVRGALLASRVLPSGSSIEAASVPVLGMESEVAFVFHRDLPAREQAYTRDEVAGAVHAYAAIEIVDSRFRTYPANPMLERIADCVSSGAFIHGQPQAHWRTLDLVNIPVRLEIDGQVLVQRRGGHPTQDPLLPAVDLANDLRASTGIAAGQRVTTGTYTGLTRARPGQRVRASFDGLGEAVVDLR